MILLEISLAQKLPTENKRNFESLKTHTSKTNLQTSGISLNAQKKRKLDKLHKLPDQVKNNLNKESLNIILID